MENLRPLPRAERAGEASTLTPLEYTVAVWVGRWADIEEISCRLDLPWSEVEWLIRSTMRVKGCRNAAELQAMFEPDWARIDNPPESRYEKVNGRMVLRGSEQARALARRKYAEKSRN